MRKYFRVAYQNQSNMREALVCLADVLQAEIIQQYLLDDEGGDSFGQIAARFHDAQTKRNDFRC